MFIKTLLRTITAAAVFYTPSEAVQWRTVDTDTAWKEGQFSGTSLSNVTCLIPGKAPLTADQQAALTGSWTLKNLKELNLKGLGISDAFVEDLCKNRTFERVIRIDFSDNPQITDASLKFISDSRIGGARDLPQISARYSLPSAEIQVKAAGTGIARETAEKYNQEPQKRQFIVYYKNPVRGEQTYDPVFNAVKWVQVKP